MRDAVQENTVSVRKGGRCWNGAHRDAGTLIHLINAPSDVRNVHGSFATALCGAEPGRRSYGWTPDEREVNCLKCKNKLNVQTTTER